VVGRARTPFRNKRTGYPTKETRGGGTQKTKTTEDERKKNPRFWRSAKIVRGRRKEVTLSTKSKMERRLNAGGKLKGMCPETKMRTRKDVSRKTS